jgi:hypothetical protein
MGIVGKAVGKLIDHSFPLGEAVLFTPLRARASQQEGFFLP